MEKESIVVNSTYVPFKRSTLPRIWAEERCARGSQTPSEVCKSEWPSFLGLRFTYLACSFSSCWVPVRILSFSRMIQCQSSHSSTASISNSHAS